MSENFKRTSVILLIIIASIAIGICLDLVWDIIEKKQFPTSYDEIITDASKEFDVPKEIIYATIKVESDFDPEAISDAGAQGLMQMLPSTFEWLTGDEHLAEHLSKKELDNPEVNIRYGTYYLSYLFRKFNYNWDTAIAAYNAGETVVRSWLRDSEYSDGKGNLIKIPYPETEKYVKKMKNALEYYTNLNTKGDTDHGTESQS